MAGQGEARVLRQRRLDDRLHVAFDAGVGRLVAELAADGIADPAQEIADLGFAVGLGGPFGEAMGIGAFEQPGGGPPIAAGLVVEHITGVTCGFIACRNSSLNSGL